MAKSKFGVEFKRQMRLAIAAAIGFIIAFSWRDFIFELTRNWIINLELSTNIHLINLTSSILITIFGVFLIVLSSRLLEK